MSTKGVDKTLADALTRTKTAKPDNPHYFVLVLKGGTDGILLVDRKKISPPLIADAKKRSGGSAVVSGFCHYDREGGEFVFETRKPPVPTWAQVVKKISTRDANLTIKARFGLLTNPLLLAQDTEGGPETDDQQKPTEEKAKETTKPSTALDAFNQRAQALESRLVTFLKGTSPNVATVKLTYSEAKLLARKGDLDAANANLDKVEELLKQGDKAPTPSHDNQHADPEVLDKVKALMNRLTAVADANPDGANALRQELKAVLAGPPKEAAGKLEAIESRLVSMERAAQASKEIAQSNPVRRASFHKARDQWNQARTLAKSQLQKFAQAILADPEAKAEPDWEEIRAAAEGLPARLDAFDASLGEALTRAGSDETRESAAGLRDAQTLIEKYRNELASKPIFELTDGHAYGDFKVAAVLSTALDAVAKRLVS